MSNMDIYSFNYIRDAPLLTFLLNYPRNQHSKNEVKTITKLSVCTIKQCPKEVSKIETLHQNRQFLFGNHQKWPPY